MKTANVNEEPPLDVTPEDEPPQEAQQTMALARPLPQAEKKPVTAAQAKTNAVASLTATAYERASQLQLTQEEVAKLTADFPDEAFKPGAGGKEHLIYIEHAFLRDRLSEVFGLGQWALIPRSRWQEEFETQNKKAGIRIYVEAMLLVRGCFVGEAIGDMEYYPHNAGQNYGDAVEGAKTAAFRRCAKEFGVGLQAWKKDFGDGWWERFRAKKAGGVKQKMDAARGKPAAATATAPPVAAKPAEPRYAGPKARDWMISKLPARERALEYAKKMGILLPNEGLNDWPFQWVPISKEQLDALIKAIKDFDNGLEAKKPYLPNPIKSEEKKTAPAAKPEYLPTGLNAPYIGQDGPNETPPLPPNVEAAKQEDPEWWRDIICPIPHKGMKRDEYMRNPETVGQLYDGRHDEKTGARLFYFMENFEVKTTWLNAQQQEKPRRNDEIERDLLFRDALDACHDYHEQHESDRPPEEERNVPTPAEEEAHETPYD